MSELVRVVVRMLHQSDPDGKAPRSCEVYFPPFTGYERKSVDLIWGISRHRLDLTTGRLSGRVREPIWRCHPEDLEMLRAKVREKAPPPDHTSMP